MYRKNGNRLAFDLSELNDLKMGEADIAGLLESEFDVQMEVRDIRQIARSKVGKSIYVRGSRFSEAPEKVDCSLFVKWVYGQMGIEMPRFSVVQCAMMDRCERNDLEVGDLVVTKGRKLNYVDADGERIGHIGIYAGDGKMIHATSKYQGVVEEAVEEVFDRERELVAYGKVVKNWVSLRTLILPESFEVEYSADVKWAIVNAIGGVRL